jgi:hypothetical protein
MSKKLRRLNFCPRQDRASWTAALRPGVRQVKPNIVVVAIAVLPDVTDDHAVRVDFHQVAGVADDERRVAPIGVGTVLGRAMADADEAADE